MDLNNVAHEIVVESTSPLTSLERFRRSVNVYRPNHTSSNTANTLNNSSSDFTQEFFRKNPQLQQSFAETVSHAVAPKTLTNYSRVTRDFEDFCARQN